MRVWIRILVAALGAVAFTSAPAQMPEKRAHDAAPAVAPAGDMEGVVAYYGRKFAGRRTASGERFDPAAMTMAHRTLPFGTRVKVTNLANRRSVVVRVNDRGPHSPDRIGDLSLAAANRIGLRKAGTAKVKLEIVGRPRGRR